MDVSATGPAAAVAALLAAGCGLSPEEGTARMAERLATIAAATDPDRNAYANGLRVEYLERRLALGTPGADLRLVYAAELLRAGRTDSAIEELDALEGRVDAALLDGWLATAYMRLGEQENCQAAHTVESCLVPISGAGVHRLTDGSTGAIAHLDHLLAADPDDLGARWLLNVAHMTLGTWPDGIPPQQRIGAAAFASTHDVGRFHDRAAAAGADVFGLSGGVVMEDLDGDLDLDILCSSWGLLDPLRLLVNSGDGTFADRTETLGLDGVGGGLNLVHADHDNDGDIDVLVLRGAWLGQPPCTDGGAHPNSLLENRGDGSFHDATEARGLLSLRPTQTAVFGDLDGDGWLDLFVGNESSAGARNPCELFLSDEGDYRDVAAEAGADLTGVVKGVAAGDVDDDGDLDLFASRLGDANALLRNEGAERGIPRFTDVAQAAGVREPRQSFPAWFWDYDNDGHLDLFVSGYGAERGRGVHGSVAADLLGIPTRAPTPRLYRNRGGGSFDDVTAATGLDAVLVTMGSNHGDLDSDGWPDLYLGTGDPDLRSIVPNRMFRNDAGRRFQDVTAAGGFGHLQKGHGIAFGDLDQDGDQDVYAVMGGAYEGDGFWNALFENPGHGNRWVVLLLEGTRSNRSAVGARVAVHAATPAGPRTVHVVVGTGGSFGSASLRQEIGLGDATGIEAVEVRWPGRTRVQRYLGVGLDGAWRLVEGEAAPTAAPYEAFALAR